MITCPKGSYLFHASDTVTHMYYLAEGEVDLVRSGRDGDRIILQRARSGRVIAEASAYSPFYHCDGIARASASCRAITVTDFRKRLAGNARLQEMWAKHLAETLQRERLLTEIRTRRTVAARLDAWMGTDGEMPAKGQWQELAGFLGVTREALYRELARRKAKD